MSLTLAYLFIATIPAIFLAIATILAVGLSLGPSRIIIRLPMFLLGSVGLASLVCLLESNSNCWPFALITVVLGLLGFAMRDRLISIFACCSGIPLILLALMLIGSGEFPTRSFTASILATGLLAGFFSVLRFAGYRLTSLVSEVSADDLRLATGLPIDRWVDQLDETKISDASFGNYAQTMGRLQTRGLTTHWQKIVAKAYERASGRMPVERTSDGGSVLWPPAGLAEG